MTHLKTIGLAALAILALAAITGATTASATVLCKEELNPCGAADYASGTAFTAKLVPGASDQWKYGEKVTDTCTESTFSGKTTNTGGSTSTVSIALTSVTWKGCTVGRESIKPGTIEVHYGLGGLNGVGTLTMLGAEWKEAGCTYGTAAGGTHSGWVTKPKAGSNTVFDFLVLVPKIAGGVLCPPTTQWEAQFTIVSPTPLYISPS